MKRINCCGPSGTGKSTMAKYISETCGIPFLETSTKPLWKAWGIKSHKDILLMSTNEPERALIFQYDVLKFRKELMESQGSYVTDRSPIDNIAYFLFQCAPYLKEEQIERYVNECLAVLENTCNLLLVFPFLKEQPLEDDGARIASRYFQSTMNSIFQNILMGDNPIMFMGIKNKPETLILHLWDLELRKKSILSAISGIEIVQKLPMK